MQAKSSQFLHRTLTTSNRTDSFPTDFGFEHSQRSVFTPIRIGMHRPSSIATRAGSPLRVDHEAKWSRTGPPMTKPSGQLVPPASSEPGPSRPGHRLRSCFVRNGRRGRGSELGGGIGQRAPASEARSVLPNRYQQPETCRRQRTGDTT